MSAPTDQHRRWFATKQRKWPQFWNRLGFNDVPNLRDKKFLDVGSGLGGNSLAAAKQGALVIALEPHSETLALSKTLIKNEDPEAYERIRFVEGVVEEFDEKNSYDFIICDEVFEHLLDFEKSIDQLADLLNETGTLCSGWGPLWHSPVGGHQLNLNLRFKAGIPRLTTRPNSHTGFQVKFPYGHRILNSKARKLYSVERNLPPVSTIQQVGMNGLSVNQFRATVESSRLHIVSWHENTGTHTAYKILRLVGRIPTFRNLATSNVYATFRKAR